MKTKPEDIENRKDIEELEEKGCLSQPLQCPPRPKKYEGPVSLYPLELEEVLKSILRVKE